MKSVEDVDGLMSKGTINKKVPDYFNFAFVEAAPVGSILALLSKIRARYLFYFQ